MRWLSYKPIRRTILDLVYVLNAIVGLDPRDREATQKVARFIPVDGYKKLLNEKGLE